MFCRRIELRLTPNVTQGAALEARRGQDQALYNAALQGRRDAWARAKVSVGFAAQCRSLTVIRADDPEGMGSGCAHSQQHTLRRVDRAFQAFFRRVRAGQTPGYPRFKSAARYPGWTHTHGQGARYTPKVGRGDRWYNGTLKLAGIGRVRCRGRARAPAERVLEVTITKRQDQWYASLAVEMYAARAQTGDRVAGLDWGVETLATLAYGPGEYAEIPNDRLFQAQAEKAREAARALSKALRGRKSATAASQRRQVAKGYRHLANRRKDRAHKLSACLATTHRRIVTEALTPANMTRSAKGTVDAPGCRVAQKTGLNREVLDTAPGMLMRMIATKAEEAGCVFTVIDARRHKPSQTCPKCLARRKKVLAERGHSCPCGFTATRDQAAALLMLRVGLQDEGQELTWGSRLETPPTAA